MISFRLSVIALSATLMFSVGSSASTATTNYSHPEFSVADDRTLNLRETGSQIVVETIENALRQGGLALLGEGFQLDSSLTYHSGDNEGIEGDLDVVVPLWNGGRHAIFTQPGFVFWKGLEGEKRFDGNIGFVYRAELTRNLIAGASIFYDHDFQIGHSRVSGGLDLQSGFFRFGANYYHPLSEIEDGREGFVEEALSGMDARLVFEREAVRLGSTIGYWDYKGEESGGQEDSRSGWKTSIGLDFGVRILPGVFAEASWERHKDNIVLDERIFAGLAFRFSLPDFEGASYGSGEMTSNLYKIVDREKRILYEERVAGPTVSVALPDGVSANVEEGDTANVQIQLSEVLLEDVTINLVGSGTAEYGSSNDYTVSVGGTTCTEVTENNCQVMIAAGNTSAPVEVSINEDGGGESPEIIILSTVIALAGNTKLMPGGSLTLTIPADPPLPGVSLSSDSTSIRESGMATITLTLSEELGDDATFNLIATNTSGTGRATYGTDADWNLDVNGTNCGMASESNPCQVTISRGNTTAEVTVEIREDMTDETTSKDFTVSVVVDPGSVTIVQPGNSSSLNFTIPADLSNVSLNYSGNGSIPTQISAERFNITMNRALDVPVTVNIIGSSVVVYDPNLATTITGSWSLHYKVVPEGEQIPNTLVNGTACSSVGGTGCPITISPGQTIVDLEYSSILLTSGQTITLTLDISGSENLVKLGNPITHTLTAQ